MPPRPNKPGLSLSLPPPEPPRSGAMIRFENLPPEVMQSMCTPMHQILPAPRGAPSPAPAHSAGAGRLWLGSMSALNDRQQLEALGITHLVQVLDVPWLPLTEKDGFACLRIDILDVPTAELTPHLESACNWIDRALRSGKNVLIHCQQGVSRSPAITLAYLIRHRAMSYDAALAYVRGLRACIKPNAGFVACLREWERTGSGGGGGGPARPAYGRRITTH